MQGEERRIIELYHWQLIPWGIEIRTANHELGLVVDVADGYGPQEWQPLTVVHDTVHTQANLEVDRVNITIPNAIAQISGVTPTTYEVAQLVMNGALDGAEIIVYLYDLDGGNTFHHSTWRVEGAPSVTRAQVVLHLQSEFALLAREVPRTIVAEQCNNQLFDGHCGLVEAAFQVLDTATGGTVSELYGLTDHPPGWFDNGEILFTTGNNFGARRFIHKYEPGWVTFLSPLRYPVAAGDAFSIVPGCAKTVEVCDLKFNNLDHFRGYPYIPSVESIV